MIQAFNKSLESIIFLAFQLDAFNRQGKFGNGVYRLGSQRCCDSERSRRSCISVEAIFELNDRE
jgi:hypothetical protein